MPPNEPAAPASESIALTVLRQAPPYALTLLAVAASVALRQALEPVFSDRTLLVLFVPAVLLAAAAGGAGTALLATGLGLAFSFLVGGHGLLADPVVKARIDARIPMGRLGTARDLAGVAAFLLSDAAGYITGQVINVDGGWLAA